MAGRRGARSGRGWDAIPPRPADEQPLGGELWDDDSERGNVPGRRRRSYPGNSSAFGASGSAGGRSDRGSSGYTTFGSSGSSFGGSRRRGGAPGRRASRMSDSADVGGGVPGFEVFGGSGSSGPAFDPSGADVVDADGPFSGRASAPDAVPEGDTSAADPFHRDDIPGAGPFDRGAGAGAAGGRRPSGRRAARGRDGGWDGSRSSDRGATADTGGFASATFDAEPGPGSRRERRIPDGGDRPAEPPRTESEVAREICLRQLAVRPRTRAELA
jgi:regulatory protein